MELFGYLFLVEALAVPALALVAAVFLRRSQTSRATLALLIGAVLMLVVTAAQLGIPIILTALMPGLHVDAAAWRLVSSLHWVRLLASMTFFFSLVVVAREFAARTAAR